MTRPVTVGVGGAAVSRLNAVKPVATSPLTASWMTTETDLAPSAPTLSSLTSTNPWVISPELNVPWYTWTPFSFSVTWSPAASEEAISESVSRMEGLAILVIASLALTPESEPGLKWTVMTFSPLAEAVSRLVKPCSAFVSTAPAPIAVAIVP